MPLPAVLASLMGGGAAGAGASVSSVAGAAATNAAAGAATNAVSGMFSKLGDGAKMILNPIGAMNDSFVKMSNTFFNVSHGAIKMITELDNAGQTIRNVGAIVTAPMKKVIETIDQIPIVGQMATASMKLATSAVDTFFGVFSMFPDTLKIAGDMSKKLAQQYVEVFSPNTVKLFQKAVRDLDASIGENLVPVIRLAQQGFRYFGDRIAGMTSTVKPAIESMMTELKNLAQAFDPVITAMSTLGKITFKVAGELAPVVSYFGKMFVQMTPLYKILMMVGDAAARMAAKLGIDMSDDTGKSQDKAFQQASTTSIGSIISKTQENAFGLGKEAAAETTAKSTTTSALFLTEKLLPALGTAVRDIVVGVRTAILELPGLIAKAILYDVPKFVGEKTGKAAFNTGKAVGNFVGDAWEATKTVGKPGESYFERVGRMRKERNEDEVVKEKKLNEEYEKNPSTFMSDILATLMPKPEVVDPLALRGDMRAVLPPATR
jgi:hypothetical protein